MEKLLKKQDELAYKIEWAIIHDVDPDEIRKMYRELDTIDEEIAKLEGLL